MFVSESTSSVFRRIMFISIWVNVYWFLCHVHVSLLVFSFSALIGDDLVQDFSLNLFVSLCILCHFNGLVQLDKKNAQNCVPMHTSVAIRCHRSLFANHSFSYILMCHFCMDISCERLTTISFIWACTVYSLHTTLNTSIRRYNLCRQTMLFVQSITESILVFATTVFACAGVCVWVTFFSCCCWFLFRQ